MKTDYIPVPFEGFVEFGIYPKIYAIINAQMFTPTYIYGLSGNGKTLAIQQACAKLNRELIKISINPRTDEDDLIGGLRLVDGNTIFEHGPVIQAMKRGAILLLDEIDRGSNNLMCLQSILEGGEYYIKKTGERVVPVDGFNIIATGNTKGRGADDNRYSSATVLDDAFLERFPITLIQEYPSKEAEENIIRSQFSKHGINLPIVAENLALWAGEIRKQYQSAAVSESVTTRRLIHIINTYAIFGDEKAAIEHCISRFDDQTKNAFIDFYDKVAKSNEKDPRDIKKPDPENKSLAGRLTEKFKKY